MITFQRMGYMGQLANQMCQYATMLGICSKNGYECGLPFQSNTKSQNRFKRLVLKDGFPNVSCRDSSYARGQRLWVEPDNTQWTFNPKVLQLPDGTDLQGYYQTERYFDSIRDRILKEFEPMPITKGRVGNYVAALPKPIVFIHVRRGDALTHGTLTRIGESTDYFHRAVKEFPEGTHFIVLSDDMAWCRAKMFNYDTPSQDTLSKKDMDWRNKYVNWSPYEDKFMDLELMRQCDGGIICNSSFSWWGAWLGSQSRKIVAPANWSTNVSHPDVVPDRWTKVQPSI